MFLTNNANIPISTQGGGKAKFHKTAMGLSFRGLKESLRRKLKRNPLIRGETTFNMIVEHILYDIIKNLILIYY